MALVIITAIAGAELALILLLFRAIILNRENVNEMVRSFTKDIQAISIQNETFRKRLRENKLDYPE